MKIKRFLTVLMAFVLVLGFCACGNGKNGETVDSAEYHTMGDAFAVESEDTYYGYDENHFVYVFESDGTYMRVIADITEDLRSQLGAVDPEANDSTEQIYAIVSTLQVKETLNLSAGVLSSDELKAMAGRPAEELLEEGFTCSDYINEGNPAFYLSNGYYIYKVTVKEKDFREKYSEDGHIDIKSTFRSLTVRKMTYEGLNYEAMNDEF